MTDPTPDQIAKLPKHIQRYISNLEHDLTEAKRQHAELFASQEITPISFHSELSLKDNPVFLTPARYGAHSPDTSKVRFWMNGTRWKPNTTREYLEIGRGVSTTHFTRDERDRSEDDCISVRAMDSARIVVEPIQSSEVIIRYKRW